MTFKLELLKFYPTRMSALTNLLSYKDVSAY